MCIRDRFTYHAEYKNFTTAAEMHKMKAEHLATRNKIWADSREKNDAEIAKCKARIEELEGQNRQMAVAEEALNEQLGEDAEAWEGDKVKLAKFTAYFELETDELEM